jgi:hypothetical protein
MTAQMQLPLGVVARGTDVAAVIAITAAELDHLRARPEPDDAPNRSAHTHLERGYLLLLDWLEGQTELPDDHLAWPCSACFAPIGAPCDLPDRRDRWTPPGPRHHIDRGVVGRWGNYAPAARARALAARQQHA